VPACRWNSGGVATPSKLLQGSHGCVWWCASLHMRCGHLVLCAPESTAATEHQNSGFYKFPVSHKVQTAVHWPSGAISYTCCQHAAHLPILAHSLCYSCYLHLSFKSILGNSILLTFALFCSPCWCAVRRSSSTSACSLTASRTTSWATQTPWHTCPRSRQEQQQQHMARPQVSLQLAAHAVLSGD
jgi:hypothetical protein